MKVISIIQTGDDFIYFNYDKLFCMPIRVPNTYIIMLQFRKFV